MASSVSRLPPFFLESGIKARLPFTMSRNVLKHTERDRNRYLSHNYLSVRHMVFVKSIKLKPSSTEGGRSCDLNFIRDSSSACSNNRREDPLSLVQCKKRYLWSKRENKCLRFSLFLYFNTSCSYTMLLTTLLARTSFFNISNRFPTWWIFYTTKVSESLH